MVHQLTEMCGKFFCIQPESSPPPAPSLPLLLQDVPEKEYKSQKSESEICYSNSNNNNITEKRYTFDENSLYNNRTILSDNHFANYHFKNDDIDDENEDVGDEDNGNVDKNIVHNFVNCIRRIFLIACNTANNIDDSKYSIL